jgi:hypothetical protein
LDFDVNNLKVSQAKANAISLKRPEQGPPQQEVLQHVEQKSLLVLKPANEVAGRITKMQQRGWSVSFR